MPDPNWPVTETVVDCETPYFTLGHDVIVPPDRDPIDYYWVDRPDAVAVVALDGDDLVLVEQYRQRFDETVLELPAGGVDEGESYVEAGQRELREETGFTAGSVELLDTCRIASWTKHEQGIVVATDLTPGEQDLDDLEDLTVHRVSATDAIDRMRDHGPLSAWSLGPLTVAREDGYLP